MRSFEIISVNCSESLEIIHEKGRACCHISLTEPASLTACSLCGTRIAICAEEHVRFLSLLPVLALYWATQQRQMRNCNNMNYSIIRLISEPPLWRFLRITLRIRVEHKWLAAPIPLFLPSLLWASPSTQARPSPSRVLTQASAARRRQAMSRDVQEGVETTGRALGDELAQARQGAASCCNKTSATRKVRHVISAEE